MLNSNNREAAERFQERRRREDGASRLRDQVPQLEALRLVLDEYRENDPAPWMSHTRHIVVSRAPALFLIPCGDSDCVDGGYSLTRKVMDGLRSAATSFEGDEECYGRRHGNRCGRRVHFTAEATYLP